MTNIISLRKKKTLASDDLNSLLTRANLIRKEKLHFPSNKIAVVRANQIKRLFESKITERIISKKLIGSDIFLCGIYISNLLEELTLKSPDSWWAIDYVSDSALSLRRGGDVCFIICAVYPSRASRRLMNLAYYRESGIQFYYQFYCLSNREIGYHMSQQFETMTALTQDCLQNF